MKRLAITETAEGSDSDSSIPGLISGSDSEEDYYIDEDDDSSEESAFHSEDEEDGDVQWDPSENEQFTKYERDVIDKMVAHEPVFDEKYADERKSNPFLQLLGNLKGITCAKMCMKYRSLVL